MIFRTSSGGICDHFLEGKCFQKETLPQTCLIGRIWPPFWLPDSTWKMIVETQLDSSDDEIRERFLILYVIVCNVLTSNQTCDFSQSVTFSEANLQLIWLNWLSQSCAASTLQENLIFFFLFHSVLSLRCMFAPRYGYCNLLAAQCRNQSRLGWWAVWITMHELPLTRFVCDSYWYTDFLQSM